MHRCRSLRCKKSCRKTPGFNFYKHWVKKHTFSQESHEPGSKHEGTARTQLLCGLRPPYSAGNLLVQRNAWECERSLCSCLFYFIFFIYNKKPWSKFSGATPVCESLYSLVCVIAWYVSVQSWFCCNCDLLMLGRKDITAMALLC